MKERTSDTLIFVATLVALAFAALAVRNFMPKKTAGGPPQSTYVGHYGFAITLPPATAERMRMFGAFTNAEKTSEVVFVFPKELDKDQPFSISEERYKEFGIVRMEVNPNKNFGAGVNILKTAKFAIDTTLKEKKEPYTFQSLDPASRFEGFAVEIGSPTPLVQVFLKGEKVHYLLTAAPGDQVLRDVLEGLAEISPHDNPGK